MFNSKETKMTLLAIAGFTVAGAAVDRLDALKPQPTNREVDPLLRKMMEVSPNEMRRLLTFAMSSTLETIPGNNDFDTIHVFRESVGSTHTQVALRGLRQQDGGVESPRRYVIETVNAEQQPYYEKIEIAIRPTTQQVTLLRSSRYPLQLQEGEDRTIVNDLLPSNQMLTYIRDHGNNNATHHQEVLDFTSRKEMLLRERCEKPITKYEYPFKGLTHKESASSAALSFITFEDRLLRGE